MSDFSNNVWGGLVIGLFVAAVLLCVAVLALEELVYKRGQTDALSGKIQYELQEQPNNSVKWVRIKEASGE